MISYFRLKSKLSFLSVKNSRSILPFIMIFFYSYLYAQNQLIAPCEEPKFTRGIYENHVLTLIYCQEDDKNMWAEIKFSKPAILDTQLQQYILTEFKNGTLELAPAPEKIFVVSEEMPRFPGCDDISGTKKEITDCANEKLYEFIQQNVKLPSEAKKNRISGRVVVKFVVEKDGSISNAEVIRSLGSGCDQEALRVINLMNEKELKWTPGIQNGRPVKVYFSMPIKFEA